MHESAIAALGDVMNQLEAPQRVRLWLQPRAFGPRLIDFLVEFGARGQSRLGVVQLLANTPKQIVHVSNGQT